jgi:hypothetical protein
VALDDQQWRALLGGDGLLREGALAAPPLESAYAVLASQPGTRVDVGQWSAHAERFFRTRLGLTVDKRYDGEPPEVDAARVVVAPHGEPGGVRLVFARPREPPDLAFAELGEARAGGGGIILVARRCKTVWLVVRESDDDRLALQLATVLASVLLGPVLDVRGPDLYGVKTARGKLEARGG